MKYSSNNGITERVIQWQRERILSLKEKEWLNENEGRIKQSREEHRNNSGPADVLHLFVCPLGTLR